MKRIILSVLLLLAPALFAQTSTASAADVQALKDALAAQQQQIQKLTEQLQQLLQNSQQTQAAAADAANKAAAAQTQASQQQQSVTELKGDVAELKTSVSNAAPAVQEGATDANFGAGGSTDDSLQRPQHHAGWLCGSRNRAPLKSAWRLTFPPHSTRCPCPALRRARSRSSSAPRASRGLPSIY